MPEPQVFAVVGPTATGKSELAVALAQGVGGEIINADSMQLYAGMDIGTAKVPPDERGGIPHHLLDVWAIDKSAAVAEYQAMAREQIADILARGRVPILVGGSGLYLRGALDRLEFPGESPEIRARLYGELAAGGPGHLHTRLAALDPAAASAILPTNGRRIVRALEVIELTGRPFTATMPAFESVYDCVQIGLDRADLDERVEQRVERMMAAGLLDEVRGLLPLGLRHSPTAG
ncbi:MAG: tRNA dimethylallyltransferase, partial [Pseudonocardiales bacterium]|nr:tRNA dimethylallyltransferase [Pseudonocardiales bacterium]